MDKLFKYPAYFKPMELPFARLVRMYLAGTSPLSDTVGGYSKKLTYLLCRQKSRGSKVTDISSFPLMFSAKRTGKTEITRWFRHFRLYPLKTLAGVARLEGVQA